MAFGAIIALWKEKRSGADRHRWLLIGQRIRNLSNHRATHVHERPPNAEGSRRGGER
jgi:hypothetical protein